jgi:HK97 family phage portal protein
MDGGGGVAMSGEVVTPSNALTYHPFWRGVRLISGDVGRLPIQVRKRRAGGGSDEATGHPVWWVLTQTPSANVTPFMFQETMSVSGCVYGNEFAWIRREKWRPDIPIETQATADLGNAVEVRFIRRTRVQGYRDDQNQIWYQTTPVSASTALGPMDEQVPQQIWAKDMLHIRRMTSEGFLGLAPFQFGTNNLGKNLAAESYQSEFFLNDATPNGMIVPKEGTNPENASKLIEQLQQRHQGKGRRNRIGFMPAPAEWLKTGIDPQHIQLIDLLKFGIIEVANLLDIPPYKLGSEVSTSFRSLEERNRDYHDQTLDPWLTNWEQECLKLFSERDRNSGEYFLRFDRMKLLKSDPETLAKSHQVYHSIGVINANEIREELGKNPYDGGDIYVMQLNQGIVRPDGLENPNIAEDSGDTSDEDVSTDDTSGESEVDSDEDRAMAVVLEQAATRLTRRATKRISGISDPGKFRLAVRQIRDKNRHDFCHELRPILAIRGRQSDVEPLVDAMLDQIFQQLQQVDGRGEQLRNSVTAASEAATTWTVDLFRQYMEQQNGQNGTHLLPRPSGN